MRSICKRGILFDGKRNMSMKRFLRSKNQRNTNVSRQAGAAKAAKHAVSLKLKQGKRDFCEAKISGIRMFRGRRKLREQRSMPYLLIMKEKQFSRGKNHEF